MDLTVDDIEELLSSGAGHPVEPGASYTHLDHALQTAALLRPERAAPPNVPDESRSRGPDESRSRGPHESRSRVPDRWTSSQDELIVAGLVHDIGHLLLGVGDADHAEAAAACVRRVLGERVAGLVGLHVAAKRYLVANEIAYGNDLSADSVASLAVQGGPMSSDERSRFAALPLAADAVALRRADDGGKADGLLVDGLATWMQVVRRVALSRGSSA